MDTSLYLPSLSDDDPIWEVANYTQLMRDKLNEDKMTVFRNTGFAWAANSAWDAGALTKDTTSAYALSQSSNPAPLPSIADPGSASGTIKFPVAGIYNVRWYVIPGGDPGNGGYRIVMYGTWPGSPTGFDTHLGQALRGSGTMYWETMVEAQVRVPTANLEIRLTGIQSLATTNAARVTVTQIGKF